MTAQQTVLPHDRNRRLAMILLGTFVALFLGSVIYISVWH
jgi:hypothetical protein